MNVLILDFNIFKIDSNSSSPGGWTSEESVEFKHRYSNKYKVLG